MKPEIKENLTHFLETLMLDEEPMGIFFTDEEPDEGLCPKPVDLPTREKEINNQLDWQAFFNPSCILGYVWRARRKKTTAYFSAERFGCPGGAFYLGFTKPQTEMAIHYVSTGIPGRMEGERFWDSPDELRKAFEYIDPIPAPKKFCVFKPLSLYNADENPDIVSIFARPETLSGLHFLSSFVTHDPEVVVSPWSGACGNLVTWPLRYLSNGKKKAVVGGWDPSARKYFKTDELSFTLPYEMFAEMLNRFEDSFLTTKTWSTVREKIHRSKKAWGKGEAM